MSSTGQQRRGVARVQSYVAGAWHVPDEDGRRLADASTGETVAFLAAPGIDPATALEHARSRGGPALRELTFHQRASILRSVGKLLLNEDSKALLYDLSQSAGATAADSWIDIDGGAGVLLSYASRARRELPNSTVALDGASEPLAANGAFAAVHVLSSRRGAQLQVNAFNFPVWGMLEKLAPAFIAGLPSIVKPASVTAYLAEAVVRIIVDSGLLPDGALQLVCGPPESLSHLLEGLDGQDSLAFTGSARTAAALRAHAAFTERSARFNAEADSLNAAILAPCAGPGTAEFDLFVAEVVKEMTVKAGQKCTAIRRVLVPEAHLDAASEALAAALAAVRVGDPREAATSMGPLVSLAQRREVAAALSALREAATVVFDAGDLSSVDADAGAFMAPVLLRSQDARAALVHAVEAFGPVATLISYQTLDDAVTLAALGRGALVASVYGADRDESRVLALGIAAHHGRVLLVDEAMASASTGHGSPLPQLAHGGPGRAGGGEELGGMRAVASHMQRTAVQGSPDMLTALAAEHIAGSSRSERKGHPFKLNFDELEVGDSITTDSRVVTRSDIAAFAQSTGDRFYAHMDEEAAKRSPVFEGLVAHGYLVLSLAAGLFVWPDEGPVLANYGIDRLRFAKPTYPGDEIHVVLTCKRKTRLDGRGYGEVAWDAQVINQHDEVAASYDVLTMVANASGVNGAP